MALKTLVTDASVTVTTSTVVLKNTGHPSAHLVTIGCRGPFDGASVKTFLVPNPTNASPTIADCITVADGTFSTASAANFEIADGWGVACLVVPTSGAASCDTSIDVFIATGAYVR